MAVYGINYDEGNKKLDYESVYISCYNKDLNRVFDTGNFVKDWFNLVKYVITELYEIESYFTGSSTVDHFFMDGADELYDVAFLKTDGDVELIYEKSSVDYVKLYVPKGTKPTWNELKDMCK